MSNDRIAQLEAAIRLAIKVLKLKHKSTQVVIKHLEAALNDN